MMEEVVGSGVVPGVIEEVLHFPGRERAQVILGNLVGSADHALVIPVRIRMGPRCFTPRKEVRIHALIETEIPGGGLCIPDRNMVSVDYGFCLFRWNALRVIVS